MFSLRKEVLKVSNKVSNLDKGYIVSVDLTLEKRNDTLNFNLADNMTSDIFIKLTNKNIEIDNTLNKVFYLFILNPNKDLQYVLLTKKDSYFYANIPNELKTLKGYYKCQVLVQDLCSKEQVLSQTKFKFRVKSDVVSEAIEDDEQSLIDYSLLTNIIFRLKDLEDAEEGRVQAEIQRQKNEEERIENEAQRQSNENTRQDTFNNLKSLLKK